MTRITDTQTCAADGCRNECPRDGREQAMDEFLPMYEAHKKGESK